MSARSSSRKNYRRRRKNTKRHARIILYVLSGLCLFIGFILIVPYIFVKRDYLLNLSIGYGVVGLVAFAVGRLLAVLDRPKKKSDDRHKHSRKRRDSPSSQPSS